MTSATAMTASEFEDRTTDAVALASCIILSRMTGEPLGYVRAKRRHVLAKPSACVSKQALSSKLETDYDVGRLVLRDLA